GYGIKSSDVLYVPFNYGLFVAWWGFQAALEKEGVMIVPGGGQSSEHRVRNIIDWNATVVCCTPSYTLFLAESAKKMGLSLADSPVRIVVTAGEPGASVPATRKAIEEMWGAKCYDDVGSTEITNFGYECVAQQGPHVIESMFYAEALDPETLAPVEAGEIGELVLSNLCTESMPLLRYRIRDMVRFNVEPCACGRTFLRLDGGVLGRSDDMFHVSGTNIFPSAVENIIREFDEFSLEYQLIVPKQGSGRKLTIRVEPARAEPSGASLQDAVKRLRDSLRYRISVTPEVEIVEVGSLPRFEGKAKRVIRES
ncbi:MAG: phenylacetate--CoA ligase family protein, partial [bacterium]